MKICYRVLSTLCCLTLLSVMPAALAAESPPEAVHATVWTCSIWVEGEQAGFLDGQGKYIEPLAYNGTVYIPLRAAGEWMGCQVDWTQETQTVTLTGGGEPQVIDPTDIPASTQEEMDASTEHRKNGVDVQIRPDITILLNGEKKDFFNATGQPVYPITFQNSIFLPLRSIGELMGKEVVWVPGQPGHKNSDVIHIVSPVTEAQREEIKTYLADCRRLADKAADVVAQLTTVSTMDSADAIAKLKEMKGYLQQIQQLPHPSTTFFTYYGWAVNLSAHEMEKFGADENIAFFADGKLTYTEILSKNMGTIPLERLHNLLAEFERAQRAVDALTAQNGAA